MSRVWLRPAVEGDAARLLEWRNDPVTRQWSFSPEVVDDATHRAWLARCLADPDCGLFIALTDAGTVGQVRLDRHPADGSAEISVTVAPEARGRGLSPLILRAAERSARESRITSLLAQVRVANAASLAAFSRAGYAEISRHPDRIVLQRRVDDHRGADPR